MGASSSSNKKSPLASRTRCVSSCLLGVFDKIYKRNENILIRWNHLTDTTVDEVGLILHRRGSEKWGENMELVSSSSSASEMLST